MSARPLQLSATVEAPTRMGEIAGEESAEADQVAVYAEALSPRGRPSPEARTGDEYEDHRNNRDLGAKPRVGFLRGHPFTSALGLFVLILAAPGGYLYWDHTRHFESTDDAFITARQFTIAPKVSGYVTSVLVGDNERVHAGQVLARIDDRDFLVALQQADADVVAARAARATKRAALAAQQALIEAARAMIAADEADVGSVGHDVGATELKRAVDAISSARQRGARKVRQITVDL